MNATAANTASPKPEEPLTPVIFRKWKNDGDIIAVFPAIAASTQNWWECQSFMHHGQHGGCDYDGVLLQTRPAKPEEYADLKHELESEPYKYRLKVYRRETSGHREERQRQWRKFMTPEQKEQEENV